MDTLVRASVFLILSFADRMKRVIVLNEPELLKGDPGLFAARLAYDQRDVDEELGLIELTRMQMARLRALKPLEFHRQGRHSRDGALTPEVHFPLVPLEVSPFRHALDSRRIRLGHRAN